MGMLSQGFHLDLRHNVLNVQKLRLLMLLRLSSVDLSTHLIEQGYSNPLLDVQSRPVCPHCGRALESAGCKSCLLARGSFRHRSDSGSARTEEEPDPAELMKQPESQFASIQRQCGELPLNLAERAIAEHLLGELDDRGFLVGAVSEHAAFLNCDAARVEKVRRQLLELEPLGIAATGPRECLLIKVRTLAPDAPWAPDAIRLLDEEWDSIFGSGELDFARAARALAVPQSRLLAILRNLKAFSPYPLQGLRDDERDALPAVPDVRFELRGSGDAITPVIEILERERTAISVNRNYLKAGGDESAAALRTRLQVYRREADFLQRAVEKRWETLERVCRAIFDEQRAYFTSGHLCDTALVPLTRERIAKTLQMHPSTIGRAIEEKFAALPNGRVVPIGYFFDHNVPIRALLRSHINTEARPLTDSELCDYLARRGWAMSRRAAAYHREAANILSKKLRSRERLLNRPAS